MNQKQSDILIIGAGPAGATTSLFLSKQGIPHTIVDAATFPRDKICGDGLDLKTVRVLRHLDENIVRKELFDHPGFFPTYGLRMFSPNQKMVDFIYEPKEKDLDYPLIWTAKRETFDNFLIEKINPTYADFRQNCKVTSLVHFGKKEGWNVCLNDNGKELELNPKLVIGADGDHSVVLRALDQRKIDRHHYAGTLRQYWKGIEGMHPKGAIEVYMPPSKAMSYFYIFPLPNGEANVGYGMTSELMSKQRINLREVFADLIQNDPILKDRFRNATPLEKPKGWGLPLASLKRKTFGDNYLLIGDAASMVCPTNGEGIGTGMFCGMIAARFIEKALQKGDFSEAAFQNFDREVYRRLHGEIRAYRLMMGLKPWMLYDTILNMGFHNPLVMRKFKNDVGKWLNTAYATEIEVTV